MTAPDRSPGANDARPGDRRRFCAGLVAALLGLAGLGAAACGKLTYDSSTGRFRVPLGRDRQDNER